MWIPALTAVTIVSLLSLIGALFLVLKRSILESSLSPLLAFSSGILLGSVFFDLLPEGIEALPDSAFTLVAIGVIAFFSLEKLLQWHHHTNGDHDHTQKIPGYLSLLGDAIHNFIDGVVIAGAFLISVPLGITVTIAVCAHEIPHELADFMILLSSGFSNAKALWYNFLSATTAIAGAVVLLALSSFANESIIYALIPFTAGNFLYIAMSDLIPQLHKRNSPTASIVQVIALILGVLTTRILPHA